MEFTLFCRKICFAAIYAVLLRNLFYRGLRTFCVETNHGQNVVRGEKMTYIMYALVFQVDNVILMYAAMDFWTRTDFLHVTCFDSTRFVATLLKYQVLSP